MVDKQVINYSRYNRRQKKWKTLLKDRLTRYFDADDAKILAWLDTPIGALGDSPAGLIKRKLAFRVWKYALENLKMRSKNASSL